VCGGNQRGVPAARRNIDQRRVTVKNQSVQCILGERVGERFEHRLVHGNVTIPAVRLLVWLNIYRYAHAAFKLTG
jgi:hypothetical protein